LHHRRDHISVGQRFHQLHCLIRKYHLLFRVHLISTFYNLVGLFGIVANRSAIQVQFRQTAKEAAGINMLPFSQLIIGHRGKSFGHRGRIFTPGKQKYHHSAILLEIKVKVRHPLHKNRPKFWSKNILGQYAGK